MDAMTSQNLERLAGPSAQGAWMSLAGAAAQRGAAFGIAVAGQLLFVVALVYGLAKTPAPVTSTALTVSLLPEDVNKAEPPVPVMKPLLAAPQIVLNLPRLPQIDVALPVAAPEASTALTAVTTPRLPATADSSAAMADFQSALLRHLNRHKRYPAGARAKREQGVVYVRFTMDRRGNLMAAAVERTSRFALLNEESVALLTRAQPLPLPPRGIGGDEIELIVPVEFSLR